MFPWTKWPPFLGRHVQMHFLHYNDIMMGTIASQITRLTIVYSAIYPDAYQRKHQSSVSLAFVRGIHRGPVNSSHKWPVTRKMFPFDDVIMLNEIVWISIKISLKFVPKGSFNNITALVQIMAWRRSDNKPLSETMLTQFTDAHMRH